MAAAPDYAPRLAVRLFACPSCGAKALAKCIGVDGQRRESNPRERRARYLKKTGRGVG